MIRRYCMVCLLCFAIGLAHFQAIADALAFKDVKIHSRASPNSKPNKREGYLNVDRTGRALIFVAENRVLLTVPYGWIRSLNYEL